MIMALLMPLAMAQGLWAKSRTPRLPEAPGAREGHAGDGRSRYLVALGDSIIAGVGVETMAQALPARLSRALAAELGCRICWTGHGTNGARTGDLLQLPAGVNWARADVLVVSNGLNDVTGLAPLRRWKAETRRLYERLRRLAPGALLVQLGIPPLAHFPALPQPLRYVMGNRARRFDRELEKLLAPLAGVRHLPFGGVPDPELFAEDGYHPGVAAVDAWSRDLARRLAPVLESRWG